LTVFSRFHLHFWSQIYTTPLIFPRDTPLNRAPRHRPLQSPEARATVVVGVRRMACTRQRACCSLARVTATPRFFWLCTVLVEVTMVDLQLGGISDGVCSPRAAISGGFASSSTIDSLFLGFFCFVLCIHLVSSSTVCLYIAQILLKFLLASC